MKRGNKGKKGLTRVNYGQQGGKWLIRGNKGQKEKTNGKKD